MPGGAPATNISDILFQQCPQIVGSMGQVWDEHTQLIRQSKKRSQLSNVLGNCEVDDGINFARFRFHTFSRDLVTGKSNMMANIELWPAQG